MATTYEEALANELAIAREQDKPDRVATVEAELARVAAPPTADVAIGGVAAPEAAVAPPPDNAARPKATKRAR